MLALAGVSICGLAGSLKNWEVMAEVNKQLPKEAQFQPLFWYLTKNLRLRSEYKGLYPNGRLLSQADHLLIAAGFCLLVAACALGVFGF